MINWRYDFTLGYAKSILFGRTVSANGFTNRTKDMQRLKANFTNQVSTIIISPHLWRKSSLVKKVAAATNSSQTKIVILNVMGIRNVATFYKTFAAVTIIATSVKAEEWIANARQFLKNVTPKISVFSDPMQELNISFNWKKTTRKYSTCPEKSPWEKT